jgi:lipoate-protein ligase A
MALDHALATHVEEGHGVLRLYGWRRPTVSFGRNEPARDLYRVQEADRVDVAYVRRPTGGRAVLHHHELTYAVVARSGALGPAREAYRRINGALALALESLGADVAVSAAEAVLAPDAGPCFQSPAAGEVVAAGRKLVGSAQARVDGALLQHGSILLSGDQSLLDRLAGGVAQHDPPATLESLVGAVSVDVVAVAVEEHMEASLGGAWERRGYTPAERATADRMEKERYGTDCWTWRR